MGKIPGSAHPAFGFGAVTIAGGLLGYVSKGSKPSLGAGLVCGGLLIASGMMISGDDSQYGGHSLAAGTSALMTLGMGHRCLRPANSCLPVWCRSSRLPVWDTTR